MIEQILIIDKLDFDNLTVPISCPTCNFPEVFLLNETQCLSARRKPKFQCKCPNCGHYFQK